MFDTAFAKFLREKLEYLQLSLFLILMLLIGILINHFEHYPLFNILAPVLLLMLFSTVCIIKNVYRSIDLFKKKYQKEKIIRHSFNCLFKSDNKGFIITIFSIMIFVYFVCLYALKFITINIMGCYALSLGAGTFFLALMGYEVHIRLTICLVHLANEDSTVYLNYNIIQPQKTEWLWDLHKLSKLLKTAAVILGFLFVLENALIFAANMQQFQNKIEKLPFEFWIIWVFVFLTILLILPIITLTQIHSLRKIVSLINKKFNAQLFEKYTQGGKFESPVYFWASLQISDLVENTLKNTFYEKTGEKIIAFSTIILTNLIHVLTIYNFLTNL